MEEDLEDEDEASVEASVEAVSEHESAKSEGFDYICPPTVKWLFYPDPD